MISDYSICKSIESTSVINYDSDISETNPNINNLEDLREFINYMTNMIEKFEINIKNTYENINNALNNNENEDYNFGKLKILKKFIQIWRISFLYVKNSKNL